MKKNIAIIGAGHIGSRHLQGLKKIKSQADIFICDPDDKALKNAEQKWEEEDNGGFNGNIFFIDNINDLPAQVTLAIIATNSNVRLRVFEELLRISQLSFVVFEKFLFPSIQDYDYVSSLIDQYKIKAYVNCPRRLYPHYQKIAKEIREDGGPFNYTFEGANFGLASNAIHSIDLFHYFLQGQPFELDFSAINPKIEESKRKGYYELTGRLVGLSGNGSLLNVCSYEEGTAKNMVTITNSKRRYVVLEREGYYLTSSENNNWEWERVKFQIPYQSVLSCIFADDLLEKGSSELAPFEVSASLHLQFLEGVLPIFENFFNEKLDLCPIT